MTATRMNVSNYIYNVLDDLKIEIDVFHNPHNFEMTDLFKMATRINKKRNFLFVSTVLGKHLAVDPKIPILTGNLLANQYIEQVHGKKNPLAKKISEIIKSGENATELFQLIRQNPIQAPNPITIIGFAETATALGHAFFSSFEQNVKYIHTTIETINEVDSIINFEEEHSHASSHRVYADDLDFFNDEREIVLVDDEITTGKTAINIIRKIKSVYPSKKVFTVVSILDWRTPEYRIRYRQLEEELGITIHTVSLVEGSLTVTGQPEVTDEEKESAYTAGTDPHISSIPVRDYIKHNHMKYLTSNQIDGSYNTAPYLHATGRFGLQIEEEKRMSSVLEDIGSFLTSQRKGKKTLVIGTGEFMYIPMMIASYMGENVYFQSTTRSPIYSATKDTYPIFNKFRFESAENKGIVNFLYNIEAFQYDEIFIFIERTAFIHSLDPLLDELKQTQIPMIHIVDMTGTQSN